jgi:hypothetical protein
VPTPQLVYTLPVSVLGVGAHGPFTTPAMGAQYSAYIVEVVPGVGWPTGSANVMTVSVKHGQSLHALAVTLCGQPWLSKGVTNTTSPTVAAIGGGADGNLIPISATDTFQISLNVLQACGAPTINFYGIP